MVVQYLSIFLVPVAVGIFSDYSMKMLFSKESKITKMGEMIRIGDLATTSTNEPCALNEQLVISMQLDLEIPNPLAKDPQPTTTTPREPGLGH